MQGPLPIFVLWVQFFGFFGVMANFVGTAKVNSYEDVKQSLRQSIASRSTASQFLRSIWTTLALALRASALRSASFASACARSALVCFVGVPALHSCMQSQLLQETSAVPGRPLRGKAREDFISNAPAGSSQCPVSEL